MKAYHSPFGSYRVEVVPDDNAAADPRIPKSVLESLGPHDALMGLSMMYVRRSLWEKMKQGLTSLPDPPSKKGLP